LLTWVPKTRVNMTKRRIPRVDLRVHHVLPRVRVREHLRNMRGVLREHSGNIKGALREHSGRTMGIVQYTLMASAAQALGGPEGVSTRGSLRGSLQSGCAT
jgi:hypothetical protein